MGSRPSCFRTRRASERYSRLIEAVGSAVGTTASVLLSSRHARAHIPSGSWQQPSLAAGPLLRGMRSSFQPRSYFARRSRLRAASFLRRASSVFCRSWRMSCALHSPCTRGPPWRSTAYARSPSGRRHCGQSSRALSVVGGPKRGFAARGASVLGRSARRPAIVTVGNAGGGDGAEKPAIFFGAAALIPKYWFKGMWLRSGCTPMEISLQPGPMVPFEPPILGRWRCCIWKDSTRDIPATPLLAQITERSL
mmetsp:Transcript_99486/g.290443  ORF Transcript_99486/g.290443 Transcript_99486/m.290443 type:complete len:251 (+) Transcript_99486:143-895(+)